MTIMKHTLISLSLAIGLAGTAQAQETKVAIGISGWTGYAPLVLALETGIFKQNGLDVSIRKIPQKERHLAIASGDIQCAATSTETWIVWNANGVPTIQIFKMDQGMGADGIVARPGIEKVTDLKGKTVGVSAPGTNPYFSLAWILKKNGLSLKDVKTVTLEPAQAANTFITGRSGLDAAVTYEPYLGMVRQKPDAGKLIADSEEYKMVFDTFGCTPEFLKEHPEAAKGLTESFFQALELMETDKTRAFTIMGKDVKQTAEQFEESQSKIKWADREDNRKFFNGELQAFNKEAAVLLHEVGVIRAIPNDLDSLYDGQFLED
ncbi:ABC transporter substrate-binding protein [Paenalcaligenes niemegkensis]|uniref:ABC transporter substrate-binding protein n=1 Tax=Paenalcaligenes niemegkensis TaxID=2895469 RepID=UPI001EE8C5E2|nr:ABC transporter substrate-binding protein [Paenalcaligenes niemegkensis]MCQ9615738.1 ABC transporter substrate-binding protein [Paenalcaligenes niemegkensis]